MKIRLDLFVGVNLLHAHDIGIEAHELLECSPHAIQWPVEGGQKGRLGVGCAQGTRQHVPLHDAKARVRVLVYIGGNKRNEVSFNYLRVVF